MCLVAARLFREREDHGLAALDTRHTLLEKAELGRIDGIVREVERKERRLDSLEARGWVVVARGVEGEEEIVRVSLRETVLHIGFDRRVGGRRVGRLPHPLVRASREKEHERERPL